MKRFLIASATIACALVAPRAASAFCGFYVNGAGGEMFNDATQVTLMRMGTRTVLSMQNNYKGPTEAFALVIPVPVVLQKEDVKTLPKEVFAKVDTMGAPRLVEYWEQDPCMQMNYDDMDRAVMPAPTTAAAEPKKDGENLGVKIEAQFTVGEYQIVILSATDSSGLDTWLRQEKYQIPKNAEPLLRPYVAAGSKFFVAKVDPSKVKFQDGRADLSPLRFHYDADDFTLPIRLGLANSSGTQDLIVNILSPNQRYEVANYKNVTIPTNLDVKDEVRTRFGEFYAALFDRTVEKNPGAVVTEYAWLASTCDPCPGPNLDMGDFATLGADVLAGGKGKVAPYEGYDMVLTRLHARYGTSITDDLVFKAADAIVGGREFVIDEKTGKLEEGSHKDSMNNFQGRYAIRHEWTGEVKCDNPVRHRWGGPPGNVAYEPPKPALDLAFAPRGKVKLADLVRKDIPEIEIKASGAAPTAAPTATGDKAPADSTTYKPSKKGGCGCSTGNGSATAVLALAVIGLLIRRKR
jgi:MYXO-CTERM domain-containing protein